MSLRLLIVLGSILLLFSSSSASEAKEVKFTFQPIYFEIGKMKLDHAALESIGRVAQVLKKNPLLILELRGHSSIQKGADSLDLSRRRVDIVVGELNRLAKKHGISSTRYDGKALGSTSLPQPKEPSSHTNDIVEFHFFEDLSIARAKKKGLETVKVIYWNTLYHSLLQIGLAHGTFEEEGFNVKLIATNHSAIDQIGAICGLTPFLELGKNTFAGGVCGGSPHRAIEDGIDFVVIGGLLSGGSMLLGKPETAKKLRENPENFRGITIGRPKGISIASMILATFLHRRGIDFKKDVKWKLYESHEEVIDALVKGEVDIGDSYAPLQVRAKRDHGLVVVYNTMELFPFHPCSRLIVTRERLKKDREKYVRFMKGLIKAHEVFIKKPAAAIQTVYQYTGYSMEEVNTLKLPWFTLNPDPMQNGLIKFWKILQDAGYVKSKKKIQDYVDSTVYEDALLALMKEEPKNPYYKFMTNQFKRYNPFRPVKDS